MTTADPLYRDTLQSLFARLAHFDRQGPAAYSADLSKTERLLAALGQPHTRFRSVHIAGTNGKGSTSALVAAVLQSAGIGRVGLFTSPHLVDFSERIRVDGVPIPPARFVEWVHAHADLIARENPSFFELSVALAFDYFAQEGVDIAVIEVGLGGRLDSTNVITPLVTAVTSIGFDHTELLGSTLELIAAEKAGIFKPRVPAVVGAVPESTRLVFRAIAEQVGAPLVWAESAFHISEAIIHPSGQTIRINQADKSGGESLRLQLPLLGQHQQLNLITALTVIEQLRQHGLAIPPAAVETGVANVLTLTGLRGRLERLSERPYILADVAHNPQALAATVAYVTALWQQRRTLSPEADLHIVIGASTDKDLRALVRLLPQAATYYYVAAQNPRAMAAPELQALGEEVQLIGAYYPSVQAGVKAAMAFAAPDDVVLITGSFYVVGEAIAAAFS